MRGVLVLAVLASACGARTDLGGVSHGNGNGDAASPSSPFVQVACGMHHTCARRQDGAVFCWGLDTSAQTSAPANATSPPTQVPLGPASTIGVGAYHSCAIVASHIFCWGDDLVGQLGSSVPSSAKPLAVAVADATGVTAGYSYTCALLASGGVACWGQGAEGELGDGASKSSTTPIQTNVENVTALSRSAGGSEHTCTVGANGSVECWGLNADGEIGAGADETYSPLPELAIVSGAVSVAVADYSTCAVMHDRTLRCWGDNAYGQLGDGTVASSGVPVTAKVGGVRAVAVGQSHTCALQDGGRVSCWGENFDGELGDGTTTSSTSPVVAMDGGAIDICAGGNHTCVATEDGRVLCWGLGTSGELGAVADRRTTPTPVDGL
ncbi:MAG TPA: hypothetical protein VGH28_08625 [Polyangiaceae bacterium]